MTEKGYYKIKVYDNDVVSRKQYDQVVEENAKLKTTVINMKSILNHHCILCIFWSKEKKRQK